MQHAQLFSDPLQVCKVGVSDGLVLPTGRGGGGGGATYHFCKLKAHFLKSGQCSICVFLMYGHILWVILIFFLILFKVAYVFDSFFYCRALAWWVDVCALCFRFFLSYLYLPFFVVMRALPKGLSFRLCWYVLCLHNVHVLYCFRGSPNAYWVLLV